MGNVFKWGTGKGWSINNCRVSAAKSRAVTKSGPKDATNIVRPVLNSSPVFASSPRTVARYILARQRSAMERNMNCRFVLCLCVLLVCTTVDAAPSGVEILKETDIQGGLIVHLGCGDGTLTAELRADEKYIVQGLDGSAAQVEIARDYIRSLDLYGVVSINHFDGERLPYVDNLVNLIVVEDQGQVSMEEIMRVLAPLGAAYFKQDASASYIDAIQPSTVMRPRTSAQQLLVASASYIDAIQPSTVMRPRTSAQQLLVASASIHKPWPEEIDEWRQHFHDADNNAVARDSVVGPPRHVQWIAEPRWSRSHLGLPSVTSMVSSKGRLFDIEDLVSAEYPALPGKFALVARDAFNGILLWRHPFAEWEPVTRHIKSTPIQLQRRLAAIGDTVYCTPGFDTPVTAFDAATGEIIRTYESTKGVQEFVYDRGVLYVVVGDPMNSHGDVEEYQGFDGTAFALPLYGRESVRRPDPSCSIIAIDVNSGQRLWKVPPIETKGYQGGTLAICGTRVVFCTDTDIVCLDRAEGQESWRASNKVVMVSNGRVNGPAAMTGIAPALVLSDEIVYVADVITLKAFSLEDGEQLWTGKAYPNHFKASDLFLAAGIAWSGTLEGYDPLTGEVITTLTQEMTGPMVHDRCYRNRITEQYYIDTKTGGSDFLELASHTAIDAIQPSTVMRPRTSAQQLQDASASEYPNPWVRGTCGIGTMPCNGLLYAPPSACSCSNWVMINSLNALAPEPGLTSSSQPIEVEVKPQLEKGIAFGTVPLTHAETDSWPTYRNNPGRTGASTGQAPTELNLRWEVKMSTKASAPTIADGKVFVADIDAHTVHALDANDGRTLWSYTTGARVDSPPTLYNGHVLFGSRDGWVYCLRASDGALAWRFRGLPDNRWICAYGQIESAWPVSGSVLVKDNVLYFAAGRNSFIDGGIWLFGLDPQTGSVIHQRHMYGPYGDDGFPIIASDISGGFGLHGFKNDVFLAVGDNLYLRQQGFKADLTPLAPEEITEPHLIASAGFLEPTPHHRTWWTIDTTIRYDTTLFKGGDRPHGDVLAMDESHFYEVRGYTPGRTVNFNPREGGYTLFAGDLLKSTGKASERWRQSIPLTGKAIAIADESLFVAGTPVVFPSSDLHAAYEGRMGGIVWATSTQTGAKVTEARLAAAPAWDGMAVANGRLYMSLEDGSIVCLGDK
jgi:outer membrane protein assembly factor BamB